MTASRPTFTIASLVLSLCAASAAALGADAPPGAVSAGEYKVSGPYAHDNLTIFLIHGQDKIKGKSYLTFQEAMEKGVIKVYETGNVNTLQIENVSPDQEVYVQSGDIVKGGRQDRTIALDFVCPAKSKPMPIDAFCVEHGRWTQRGNEGAAQFSSANDQVASKQLKVAAKGASDQGEVWRQVDVLQQKASNNLGAQVNSEQSASSLQLSLENQKLQDTTGAYIKALSSAADGKGDAIGYAFAINGKVNSADVYASHELFAKLWPRLLKSSAVEAVAELQKGKKFDAAPADAVYACIADAEKGKEGAKKEVTPRVQMITRESDANLFYETRDSGKNSPANAGGWIHRNYLTKDEETKKALDARERQPLPRMNQNPSRNLNGPRGGYQQVNPEASPNRGETPREVEPNPAPAQQPASPPANPPAQPAPLNR